MNHKCNKCYQQAIVKIEEGNREFCLGLNYEIINKVKNCTEFIDDLLVQEPIGTEKKILSLEILFKSKPSENRLSTTLKNIHNEVVLLRAWARKKHKPKLRK